MNLPFLSLSVIVALYHVQLINRQFLDSTWAGVGCVKTSNPLEQLRCMKKYVDARYGGWSGAKAHSDLHGWY